MLAILNPRTSFIDEKMTREMFKPGTKARWTPNMIGGADVWSRVTSLQMSDRLLSRQSRFLPS